MTAERSIDLKQGLVIAHLGQGIAVEHDGDIHLCQTLRKLDTVAVGDRVLWLPCGVGQGRIDAILPRRSLLARPARSNKTRPVAANIDTVLIVIAAEPLCDFLLVDQYLAVCENNGIDCGLIVNKIDLLSSPVLEQELGTYLHLGYKAYRVSAKKNLGMAALKAVLGSQTSVLTGQSGVGKTSITNFLVPDKNLKTNAISSASGLGRHTTTAATLYHLDNGGDLIDSPGVAIFGLADMTRQQLAQGYREFQALTAHCKFNDCSHQQDKGCAVRNAAENNTISPNRYQRFLKLIEKMKV